MTIREKFNVFAAQAQSLGQAVQVCEAEEAALLRVRGELQYYTSQPEGVISQESITAKQQAVANSQVLLTALTIGMVEKANQAAGSLSAFAKSFA